MAEAYYDPVAPAAAKSPPGAGAQAQRDAHEQMRRALMLAPDMGLPELPDLRGVGGDDEWTKRPKKPAIGATEARALDLIIRGASKRQAAQVMGLSWHAFDYIVRRSYAALGCAGKVEAGALWRARAAELGHVPHAPDLAALRVLQGDRAGTITGSADGLYSSTDARVDSTINARPALTARQEQVLAAAASGVRVRDLPARLNCSPGAVHSLLDAVYKALDVHSLESAVARWLELQSA